MEVGYFGEHGMAISRSLDSSSGVRMVPYCCCVARLPASGCDQERGVEYSPSRARGSTTGEESMVLGVWKSGCSEADAESLKIPESSVPIDPRFSYPLWYSKPVMSVVVESSRLSKLGK